MMSSIFGVTDLVTDRGSNSRCTTTGMEIYLIIIASWVREYHVNVRK